VRDVTNRYKGLPPRTPQMLFNIVRKFYRGAVSHYDFIQTKKADVRRAYQRYRDTGEQGPVNEAIAVLFCEFHFYVTCWLQIDLALYRLARMEETKHLGEVMERFRPEIESHLKVRRQLDQTEACVQQQWEHFGRELTCVEQDRYWFDDMYFTVDEASLLALNELYQAIMVNRK
jgi:hypothetical protein